MNLHILSQAFSFAFGTVCLLAAYFVWERLIKKEGYQGKQWCYRSRWVIFFTLVMTGISIVTIDVHLGITFHKKTLFKLLQNGNNDGLTLVLGLMGVLMTLVTAVIITVSRNAIDDIRREKLSLRHNFDELARRESELDAGLKRESSRLALTLLRLQLLYDNEQQIKAYRFSTEDNALMLFRESLQAHYAKRENIPVYLKYLNDLSSSYNRNVHGPLLSLEKEYLQAIKKHYQTFGQESGKEEQDIPKLVDDIINKIL